MIVAKEASISVEQVLLKRKPGFRQSTKTSAHIHRETHRPLQNISFKGFDFTASHSCLVSADLEARITSEPAKVETTLLGHSLIKARCFRSRSEASFVVSSQLGRPFTATSSSFSLSTSGSLSGASCWALPLILATGKLPLLQTSL